MQFIVLVVFLAVVFTLITAETVFFILGAIAVCGLVWLMISTAKKEAKSRLDKVVCDELLNEVRELCKGFSEPDEFIEPIAETLRNARLGVQGTTVPGAIESVISTVIITRFVMDNYDSLRKDYDRRVRVDSYGVERSDLWFQLLEDLIVKKINPELQNLCAKRQEKLPHHYFSLSDRDRVASLVGYFDGLFRAEYEFRNAGGRQGFRLDDIQDGFDYERAIADLITENLPDWTAEVTQGSGDQGVDVMAEDETGFRVAIQCKMYSQPVGNKAVQEVAAGKGFYDADHAIVVTNHSFTKSAINLADRLGVDLVHHDNLVGSLERLRQDTSAI